jgi:ribosomal-protein-alanine N-acetyltransferase
MRHEDIAQVNDIDREAFPTQWPPPNYKHELQNQFAHYIIVRDETEKVAEPEQGDRLKLRGYRIIPGIRHWFKRKHMPHSGNPPSGRLLMVGFAGIWILADEAHLTNIAVRKRHQRRGIGERLLIAIIELAGELKANIVTLEVRVSNISAQRLYSKYGFKQVGLRRAYYVDNREDGVLMSTENISSTSFQARFQQLKRAYIKKWGIDSGRLTIHQ